MKTPELIAAEILDEEIRQLIELKRMAGIPRLYEFMRQIVAGSSNGNGSRPLTTSTEQRPLIVGHEDGIPQHVVKKSTAPNGLTETVLQYCARQGTNITIASVVAAMTKDGFQFMSKNAKVAVAGVFRRCTGTKLKLARHGSGSQPSTFNYVAEEN